MKSEIIIYWLDDAFLSLSFSHSISLPLLFILLLLLLADDDVKIYTKNHTRAMNSMPACHSLSPYLLLFIISVRCAIYIYK